MGLAGTTKDLQENCVLLLQWSQLVVKQDILRHWEQYLIPLLRKLNSASVLQWKVSNTSRELLHPLVLAIVLQVGRIVSRMHLRYLD